MELSKQDMELFLLLPGSVGLLLNETECHWVSFSLVANQTKWHSVWSFPNKTKPNYSMENNLWRKTTFDGRRHLTEEELWRKTTFDRWQPLTEDDPWWKMTFDGKQPLTEDDLWRKTTFDGRQPLMEDDLWRKMTFDRVYSILPEKNDDSVKEAPAYCRSFLDGLYNWKACHYWKF